MNQSFQQMINKYGEPQNAIALDAKDIQILISHIPPFLLDLWKVYGIGMWADGKFQFCNPLDYSGVVQLLLKNDPQFLPHQTYLYGFSAFGDLLLWNETYQRLSIDLVYQTASAGCTRANWKPGDPNNAIIPTLMRIDDKDHLTLFENTPNAPPLFKKIVKALGRVSLGECYGMFPALPLGGTLQVSSFKRVKALEHFAFLAQLGPINLIDYAGGKSRTVRQLGSAESHA
jgi:hypothetical protein